MLLFFFTFTVDILHKSGHFCLIAPSWHKSISKRFKQHHTSSWRLHISLTQVSLFQLFTSVSLTQCQPVRKWSVFADLGLPQLSLIFHTILPSGVGCTLCCQKQRIVEYLAKSSILDTKQWTSCRFSGPTSANVPLASQPCDYSHFPLKKIFCILPSIDVNHYLLSW